MKVKSKIKEVHFAVPKELRLKGVEKRTLKDEILGKRKAASRLTSHQDLKVLPSSIKHDKDTQGAALNENVKKPFKKFGKQNVTDIPLLRLKKQQEKEEVSNFLVSTPQIAAKDVMAPRLSSSKKHKKTKRGLKDDILLEGTTATLKAKSTTKQVKSVVPKVCSLKGVEKRSKKGKNNARNIISHQDLKVLSSSMELDTDTQAAALKEGKVQKPFKKFGKQLGNDVSQLRFKEKQKSNIQVAAELKLGKGFMAPRLTSLKKLKRTRRELRDDILPEGTTATLKAKSLGKEVHSVLKVSRRKGVEERIQTDQILGKRKAASSLTSHQDLKVLPSSINTDTQGAALKEGKVKWPIKKFGKQNGIEIPNLKLKKKQKKEEVSNFLVSTRQIAGKGVVAPRLSSSKKLKKTKRELRDDILSEVTTATLKLVRKDQTTRDNVDLFASAPVPILMQFVVFKIPSMPYRFIRCVLPHSVLPSDPSVCLIVPDVERGLKTDEELSRLAQTYTELLKDQGVPAISEIIPFAKLRAEYGPFEMKRRLAKSFDLFLCDGRIQGHVVHFLGKIFVNAKKTPVPIHAVGQTEPETPTFLPNLKNNVALGLRTVCFPLHNHGASYTVKVGHSELTSEQLSENIKVLWEKLNSAFPGGTANIRTVYLKGATTLGVPLYTSLEPLTYVPSTNPMKKKPVKGELSTYLGKQVVVLPTGDIKVLSKVTEEDKAFGKEVDGDGQVQKKRRNVRKDGKKVNKRQKRDSAPTDIGDSSKIDDSINGRKGEVDSGIGDVSSDEDVDNAENAYLSSLQ